MVTPLVALVCALSTACSPGPRTEGEASASVPEATEARSFGTGTLVVLNKAGNNAALVDLVSGEVYATLPTGVGPHEVAVSADGRTAVVADYGDQTPGRTLTVLDLAGRGVTATIDLGEHRRPHGIAWLPDGRRVAVTSETSGAVLLVDVPAGRVERAIPTQAKGSHMLALAPDGKRVFTSNIESGSISVLDLESGAHLRTVPTGAGAEGIDVSPDGSQLWVTNRDANDVTVLDARTLQPLGTLASAAVPIRVKLTPDGTQALVSNAMSGDLRVFDAATRREVATISVAADAASNPVPVGVLISPDGAFAYVAMMQGNEVAVVNLEERTVVGRIRPGAGPDGLAWSPLTR